MYQTSDLGEGRIDNYLISSSVHLWFGVVVLATMALGIGLLARHALKNEPVTRPTYLALGGAQAALVVQILLGIKLLDQGQGIVQLYIHYVGGLIPMGSFLVGAWFARGDSGRSSRILLALLVVGFASAVMAFTIGRSFANS